MPSPEHLTSVPDWNELLAADPDHDRQLETPQGRFQAILNLANNGAKMLEIMVMDDTFKNYVEISSAVNTTVGNRVTRHSVVKGHLVQTIGAVGAAARSDTDERDWQLTEFGLECKAALVFAMGKFQDLGISPMDALGTKSYVKRDKNGDVVTSPALARSQILQALDKQSVATETEFISKVGLTMTAIQNHLHNLKRAGLVSFESTDREPFSFYELNNEHSQDTDWPVYKGSDNYPRNKLSRDIKQAVEALAIAGGNIFGINDIVDYNRNRFEDPRGAKDYKSVSAVLNFWKRCGLLKGSRLHFGNQSEAAITDKGRRVVKDILLPLYEWSTNINSVDTINLIRTELARAPQIYSHRYNGIAQEYTERSPFIGHDTELKVIKVLSLIDNNSGQMTSPDIARHLGISRTQVARIIGQLIEQGRVTKIIGKKGRNYLLST